jgi:Tol biopolymer transport system component
MARFQREAKVLAALNHPNIAAIYGIEERALVMELVEGESSKGPMLFEDAWKIASQMADALGYAHDKGVVHRDPNPTNVKVTPDGVVKLLDFGLARAFSSEPGESQAGSRDMDSPTLTISATVAGVILGTAAYMAPEQAKGKRVDKRADIWSWAVVLYELLTGERMFKGNDAADTLAQVLTKEPSLGRVPPQLRKLLRRCLEKDPKCRLRDIGDVRFMLDERSATSPSRSWLGIGVGIAGSALVIGLGALSFIHLRETLPKKTVLRYTISQPWITSFTDSFAISPDGRYVAMTGRVNGKQQLFLRALDAFQAQPMPGAEGARYPFWSPDGRYIDFFTLGKLKKIALSGGPVQTLCNLPDTTSGLGGSWNRDDVIVFSAGRSALTIQRVSADGGVPADVTTRNGRYPVFLPDGRHFLYLLTGLEKDNGIYLGSLDGKENWRVLADESSAVFAAGRLLFIRENTLMAQPFDATSGHLTGEAFPVAEDVSSRISLYAPVTASETGVLLYQSGGDVTHPHLAWYDRGGKLLGAVGEAGFVFEPAISPDEKSVVFRREAPIRTGASDLWLRDLVRGAEQRFTTDVSANWAPFWSPQGDRIVFGSTRGSGTLDSSQRIFKLYQKAANGTGRDELLLANGVSKMPSQWSRDGRFIVYSENDPKTKFDIWALPMETGTEGSLSSSCIQNSTSFTASSRRTAIGWPTRRMNPGAARCRGMDRIRPKLGHCEIKLGSSVSSEPTEPASREQHIRAPARALC